MFDRAGASWLARVRGRSTAPKSAGAAPPYTGAEVKCALRGRGGSPRARAVHESLARLGHCLDERLVRRRFRGLEDYHRCLLRILTLYGRGWEVEAIAAQLSLFSTGVGVERAIDTAADLIAERLNRPATG